MMKSALDLLRHAVAAHKLALILLNIFVVIAATYAAVADVPEQAVLVVDDLSYLRRHRRLGWLPLAPSIARPAQETAGVQLTNP